MFKRWFTNCPIEQCQRQARASNTVSVKKFPDVVGKFLSLTQKNELVWSAEEGCEAEQIGEDARCGYLGAGAGAAYDHRLSVVTRGLEAHDVVAAGLVCERMIDGEVAHLG